jgi:hypothetical protein
MLETDGTRSAHDRELRLFLPGAPGMSKEGNPALTTGGKTEASLRRSIALAWPTNRTRAGGTRSALLRALHHGARPEPFKTYYCDGAPTASASTENPEAGATDEKITGAKARRTVGYLRARGRTCNIQRRENLAASPLPARIWRCTSICRESHRSLLNRENLPESIA